MKVEKEDSCTRSYVCNAVKVAMVSQVPNSRVKQIADISLDDFVLLVETMIVSKSMQESKTTVYRTDPALLRSRRYDDEEYVGISGSGGSDLSRS